MNAPVAVARTEMTAEEWQTRVDLAACLRLCAHYGWADALGTHITARVPGEEAFLINPYELFFEEVTASSLIKLDVDGNLLSPTAYSPNPAGFVVHSAVHAARPDVGCVMHLHTEAGVGVSCLTEGLLPLNQTSMLLTEDMAYHDYEGVALKLEERERLASDLGQRHLMMLRNHGTMTVGGTVGEAFLRAYLLEFACAIQMKVLATGRPIQQAPADAVRFTADSGARMVPTAGARGWAAQLRKLDRMTTDYKQ